MPMFEILDKKELAPHIKWLRVHAPLVARAAKAGQFIILRLHEKGERIPLTLFKWSKDEGYIENYVQMNVFRDAISNVWGDDIFVVTTDYETGGTALLNTGRLSCSHTEGNIYSDAVARFFGGKVYVIERWHADNVLVFNANNLSQPVRQFSVGNGNNPHDFLLVEPDKAYITLYEKPYLLIVNPNFSYLI